jgi:hypothetical protein
VGRSLGRPDSTVNLCAPTHLPNTCRALQGQDPQVAKLGARMPPSACPLFIVPLGAMVCALCVAATLAVRGVAAPAAPGPSATPTRGTPASPAACGDV